MDRIWSITLQNKMNALESVPQTFVVKAENFYEAVEKAQLEFGDFYSTVVKWMEL